MKKLPLFLALLIVLSYLIRVSTASAVKYPVGRAGVSVSASIGQYYLSLSGYIAPYASVVLTVNGHVLRSTVADSQGNFYISQVLINRGLTHFCLDAVDFKRLGDSEACFDIPPASSDITKSKIFLPPTLGLYHTTINAGSNAIAWGYSMPGASVIITIGDKTYTTTADSNGYYQISINVGNAGTYQLFAAAKWKSITSEKPTKGKTLTVLGVPGQITNWLKEFLTNLLRILFGTPYGILWLGLPILILILILLRKLLKNQKPGTVPSKKINFGFDWLFREKKLHHWWFVGY